MRAAELPAALAAAGARVRALPDRLDPAAAHAVLEAANPPRATGALAASGRVVANAATFGGGTVDYAAPVHAANPFLDRAVDAALAVVLALADDELADAITL
jgi:hypothetical protein